MQVRPFHLILFWPLRINVRARNDTGRAKDFWAFIEERMRLGGQDWERVPDPLFRGGDAAMHYQEAVYFHPFVQKVIYDKKAERAPLRIFRHTKIEAVEVELQGREAIESCTFKVERLHLYVFDTQLAILVTEISDSHEMPLRRAMQLQNELRRIYPAGWSGNLQDESKPGPVRPLHTPVSVRWLESASPRKVYERAPISNYQDREHFIGWVRANQQTTASVHWASLLPEMEPFEGADKKQGKGYHLLGDDRMAAMAFFGLKNPRDISKADMIRIGLADGPGSWRLPYAPEFLATFDKDYCYDRFWTLAQPELYEDFTTRYMCSGWAFSALANSDGYFFRDLLDYFRHHYFQMGLFVYLQHSSLLVFSDRLSEAVRAAGPEQYRESINRAATDFAVFTDRYWLTDVSNQVQGQDLYDLWVKRLRLRDLYGQVRDEVEFVNSTLQSRDQASLARRADNLSRVGYPILVCSALFGFWGSNWLEKWCLDKEWYVGSFLVIALVALLVWARYLREKD